MDLEDIKRLIDLAARSNLARLEVTIGDAHVCIETGHGRGTPAAAGGHARAPDAVPEQAMPAESMAPGPSVSFVRAPMDGLVHLAPSPGAPPFVAPGRTIAPGDTLCLIEIMKTFHPVAAERACTVRAVRVEDGQHVEHDDVLFDID